MAKKRAKLFGWTSLPRLRAILEESRRQIEETGGIPHEVFWREVEADRRAHGKKRDRVKRGVKP